MTKRSYDTAFTPVPAGLEENIFIRRKGMINGGYYALKEDLVLEGHYEEEEYTLYKNAFPVEPSVNDDLVVLNEIMRITDTESLALQTLLKVLPAEIWEDILVKGFRLAQKEDKKLVKTETSNSLWTTKFCLEKTTPKYYKKSAFLVYWYWIILPTNQLRNNPSFIRKIHKCYSGSKEYTRHTLIHSYTSHPIHNWKTIFRKLSCNEKQISFNESKTEITLLKKGCKELIESLKQKRIDLHITITDPYFCYLDYRTETFGDLYRLFRIFIHIQEVDRMCVLNHSINPFYTFSSIFGVTDRDCLYFCCDIYYIDCLYIRYSHISGSSMTEGDCIDVKDLEDKQYCARSRMYNDKDRKCSCLYVLDNKNTCSLNLDNPSIGSDHFPQCSIDQSIINHAKLEKQKTSICYRHIAEADDEHDNCVFADCCFQMLMYHELKKPGLDDHECIPIYNEREGDLARRHSNTQMYRNIHSYHFNDNLERIIKYCLKDHLLRDLVPVSFYQDIKRMKTKLEYEYIQKVSYCCRKQNVRDYIKESFNIHKIYQEKK